MNHPEIMRLNARLYHAAKMQEAQARRRARQVMAAQTTGWERLARKLRPAKSQPQQNHAHEPALAKG